jgi:hypothetical protein
MFEAIVVRSCSKLARFVNELLVVIFVLVPIMVAWPTRRFIGSTKLRIGVYLLVLAGDVLLMLALFDTGAAAFQLFASIAGIVALERSVSP